VTMSAARSPTVTFNLKRFALTVNKTGVGNGTRTQVLDGLKQGDKVVLPS